MISEEHTSRERLFTVNTGQPHEVQGIPLGNTGLELNPATSNTPLLDVVNFMFSPLSNTSANTDLDLVFYPEVVDSIEN